MCTSLKSRWWGGGLLVQPAQRWNPLVTTSLQAQPRSYYNLTLIIITIKRHLIETPPVPVIKVLTLEDRHTELNNLLTYNHLIAAPPGVAVLFGP